jgi:hypothetical protein
MQMPQNVPIVPIVARAYPGAAHFLPQVPQVRAVYHGQQAAFPISRLVRDQLNGAVIGPFDVENLTAAPDIETVRQAARALLVQPRGVSAYCSISRSAFCGNCWNGVRYMMANLPSR